MKGKLLKVEYDLPEEVRFVEDDYYKLARDMRIMGSNPYSIAELNSLFEDLSILRIVTKKGYITLFYEHEVIQFDFYPGFSYNTASIPGIFKPIKDNDCFEMIIASLFHDALYITQLTFKKEADEMFVDVIEWFHDLDDKKGFSISQMLEDAAENTIEKGIEIAFSTDEAMKSWEMGAHLAKRSGTLFRITRTPV